MSQDYVKFSAELKKGWVFVPSRFVKFYNNTFIQYPTLI